MVLVTNRFVLSSFSAHDLDSRLVESFAGHLGRGYFYNDCNYDDPASYVIIYDKILAQFGSDRSKIEEKIFNQISKGVVARVMDQGCAHGVTLSTLLRRFSTQFPTTRFEGYGVSADLKSMWLGRLKRDYEYSDAEKVLVTEKGIRPFSSYVCGEEEGPVRYFGIERDVHCVMKDFPFPLDLVISDNTYFHLVAPWLSLKRTVDSLAVGGVAMIRTLFVTQLRYMTGRIMGRGQYVDLLRRANPSFEIYHSSFRGHHPVLAVVRCDNVPFKTNVHIGRVVGVNTNYLHTFYSSRQVPDGLVSLDRY